MEKNKIELPSELIQKELEDNPLKIVELMRDSKESPPPEEHKNCNTELENNNDKIKKEETNGNNHIILNKDKNIEINDIKSYSKKNMNSLEKSINDKNIKNVNNINYIKNINNLNNIIINNNINNNNIIINNNIINHYLNDSENSKFSNDEIPNFNGRRYLGNLIKNNNSTYINKYINSNLNNQNINIYNSKEDYKYVILNNIKVLLIYLNTQEGSIFTQDFLDNIDNKELSILFNNISPYISGIMCLEYGNYFFQKLVKRLNIQQRLIIYQLIERSFIKIATDKSGTHSIQSLIDCINSPIELIALNKLISSNMLLMFLDENAYHIMMKIILEIPEEQRTSINIFIIMNVEKIITNCNGAFCVNKFINKNKDLKIRTLLIQNLQNNIHNLIINKNGCIILLLILEKFGVNYGLFIIKYIQNNIASLSSHPISMVFIMKTLNYLYKYNSFELGILIWFVYKNNILLNYLLSTENGKKILNQIIDLSDEEQKKYIFLKIKKNLKIKDN